MLRGAIELHLFDGGYAGLLIQEDAQVNLCMSVSAARLRHSGGVEQLVAELAIENPRLGEYLTEASVASWITISNVRTAGALRRALPDSSGSVTRLR
jgi:hypothetical protein